MSTLPYAPPTSGNTPPDQLEELVGEVKDGDQAAMERLYGMLMGGLRGYFRRQLPHDSAEDRAHNVFVITVNAIRNGQLREPGRLGGFVRTVSRRQAADAVRLIGRMRLGVNAVSDTTPDARANPEEALWEQQRLEQMRWALASLGGRDREILARFYVDEQPVDVICLEMGLNPNQFRLLKSRAKARLVQNGRPRKLPGRESPPQPGPVLKRL